MKIALGSDHAGWRLKNDLAAWLRPRHRVVDAGTHSGESVDYPDYAAQVASGVSRRRFDRGILICGTGIGMSITANKFRGVRAAVAWSPAVARLAAEHNNANVLCLSARFLTRRRVRSIVRAWLSTPFAGGRHARRVRKIQRFEKGRGAV